MTDSIIAEIKSAGAFALILDESLDISRHEQAAVVLRYENPEFAIKEEFVGFFRAVQVNHYTNLYRVFYQNLNSVLIILLLSAMMELQT